MLFRGASTEGRRSRSLVVVGYVFLCTAAFASAQNPYPKDEIFGGYSLLFPNGWEELDYKANTIPNAFDVSKTYYFCKFCNFGLLLDGSGHYKGAEQRRRIC